MSIVELPSPNYNQRNAPIDILLLHYTGMQSAQAALDRLCDSDAKVSAHYVVDEDGTTYRLVAEEFRAWHAGAGSWHGETDMNSRSVGIEIVNPGHFLGYPEFPDRQIEAVIDRFDQAGFLETERFAARRRALEEAFRRSPVRPASHAGGAYAGEPEGLTAQIEAFFSGPGGPDHPESGPTDGAGPAPLTALIAPHIDFHRGGPTYGWAYKEVLDRSDADLYVKRGSAPTTSSYDCRPYVTGNSETCNISPATAGTYYVMVRAYSSYSGVTLTGSYTP